MKKKIGVLVILSFMLMITASAYGAPFMKKLDNFRGLNFLNSCTVKQLVQIRGIGQKTADAIISYRNSLKNKKFKTYKDLLKVKNEKGKFVFLKKDGTPNKKYMKSVSALKSGTRNIKAKVAKKLVKKSGKKVIKTKKTFKKCIDVKPLIKTADKVKKTKKIKKFKKIKKMAK